MSGLADTIVKPLMTFKGVLVKILDLILIVAVSVLVLDVLWGVITRYMFGEQAAWTEELARAVLIWVVLLGGAVAYGANEHLGLDYFVGNMAEAAQKKMAIISTVIVLCFSIFVLIIGGSTLVSETLELEQMLMALGIPKGYVYAAVPVSGVFFVIFGLEELVELLFGNSKAEEITC